MTTPKIKRRLKKAHKSNPDGFFWEEWRKGAKVAEGWHNGTSLNGDDQTENVVTDWRPEWRLRGRILGHAGATK